MKKPKKNRDGQIIMYQPKDIEKVDTFDWGGFWKEQFEGMGEKNEKGKKRKGK